LISYKNVPPFQGWVLLGTATPGRCPGLSYYGLSALAQNTEANTSRIAKRLCIKKCARTIISITCNSRRLERFHKRCNRWGVCCKDSGLFYFWRRFGTVTRFFKPVPSPKPRQKSKILAAHRYIISCHRSSFLCRADWRVGSIGSRSQAEWLR